MDFEQIVLSKRDLRALRRSCREPIRISDHPDLMSKHFVSEVVEPVPGLYGNRTGLANCSKLGQDYLAYIRRRTREYRQTRRLAILSLIISIISLIWTILR